MLRWYSSPFRGGNNHQAAKHDFNSARHASKREQHEGQRAGEVRPLAIDSKSDLTVVMGTNGRGPLLYKMKLLCQLWPRFVKPPIVVPTTLFRHLVVLLR